MRPYITFVVCTRNDDYAGGLKKCYWSVRYLAEQCDAFGLEAELILVEWNPPAERTSLAEEFRDLPPSRNLTVRVLTVPPAIHSRYRYHDRRPMHAAVAANVGLCRGRGEFGVFKVADAFYPDSVIRRMAERALREDRLYRLERWDVSSEASAWLGKPRAEFLALCSAHVTVRNRHLPQPQMPFSLPDLFGNASGDFQLLAYGSWHRLRGYCETADVTSFEVDSMLSYSAYALGVAEERLAPDACIFKILHGSSHIHRLGEEQGRFFPLLLRIENLLRRLPYGHALVFWLRALFNYPAKTYSGIRKPVYERSLVRLKLLSMFPLLIRLRRADWGLANESFEEAVLSRAPWDRG